MDMAKILKVLDYDTEQLQKVFKFFRHYFGIGCKCHIYSFVEHQKFYRMVYSLIFSRKNSEKKIRNTNEEQTS